VIGVTKTRFHHHGDARFIRFEVHAMRSHLSGTDLLGLVCMIAVGYVLLTFGPLP
jgi:hypothetical protein